MAERELDAVGPEAMGAEVFGCDSSMASCTNCLNGTRFLSN